MLEKYFFLDRYADSNARQRSADCMADDVTAMQSQCVYVIWLDSDLDVNVSSPL